MVAVNCGLILHVMQCVGVTHVSVDERHVKSIRFICSYGTKSTGHLTWRNGSLFTLFLHRTLSVVSAFSTAALSFCEQGLTIVASQQYFDLS